MASVSGRLASESLSPQAMRGYKKDSNPLLLLQRKIDLLRMQRRMFKTNTIYEESKNSPIDEKVLEQNIADMLKEAENEAKQLAIRKLPVSKLIGSDVLYKVAMSSLRPDDEVDVEIDGAVTDELQNEVYRLISERSKVSSQIIRVNEEMSTLKEDNLKMELKLSESASRRFMLMKKLHKKEEKRRKIQENKTKSERAKRLESKIKTKENRIQTNCHVIQQLISHGGLNWAQDEDLLNLVLECGKPISEQLETVAETRSDSE